MANMTVAQATTRLYPVDSRRRWVSGDSRASRCWRRTVLAAATGGVLIGSMVGAGNASATLTVTRNYDGTWMYSGFSTPQNCGQFAWAHFPQQTAGNQIWCFQNPDRTWHLSVPERVD